MENQRYDLNFFSQTLANRLRRVATDVVLLFDVAALRQDESPV